MTTGSRTVRDATLEMLRGLDLTTIFANPGSTEVGFLTDLPEDLDFVLALHEGSVVGMATGWAIARRRPALVQLHTTAGLGNAVGALATARVNRAPLVVLVGQQDRRHLAQEPFLAGRLEGLAGDYPVWVKQPERAQDVPAAIARAHHEASTHGGPALVIVPMDDWHQPAGDPAVHAAPRRVLRPAPAPAALDPALEEVAALVDGARSPALVAGAANDDEEGWAALVALAERLGCPVWQESFGARAGFPQDHALFAGHLPADRPRLRALLAPHDVVVAVGAPVFRQYQYHPGPLVEPATRTVVVSADAGEIGHSPADVAVHTPVAPFVAALAERVRRRPGSDEPRREVARPLPPEPGRPLAPGHVFAALAERAAADTIFVEETPSSRPEMHALLPARRPLGFLSAAMGGLGFALPAATGARMADPRRPVVAVVGDGSAMYQVQALWSAARYGAGVLFVVLSNGRYAIMDRLAEGQGGKPPWPAFDEVSVAEVARGLGCPARRITSYDDLITVLDEVVPTLTERTEPLVLDVEVTVGTTFAP
ncbi:thiamine pyrophosphate-dependent enzyme [Marinactinospora thermotolerans]|uniref:Benzoylformate decarboxylase n=1 Tax=Marinactinospora thermotolerans DSM 45154 TaxID=1122192 RepID=A0A1T4LUM4_9ACTN|nr:thiamine pyrophosphate-dependent enzyme [Marinactinospora thermotolerans]SJZ58326.1 benzoylformate decarboxylase [Marinactinospora thermotolerans DSM 45154]